MRVEAKKRFRTYSTSLSYNVRGIPQFQINEWYIFVQCTCINTSMSEMKTTHEFWELVRFSELLKNSNCRWNWWSDNAIHTWKSTSSVHVDNCKKQKIENLSCKSQISLLRRSGICCDLHCKILLLSVKTIASAKYCCYLLIGVPFMRNHPHSNLLPVNFVPMVQTFKIKDRRRTTLKQMYAAHFPLPVSHCLLRTREHLDKRTLTLIVASSK